MPTMRIPPHLSKQEILLLVDRDSRRSQADAFLGASATYFAGVAFFCAVTYGFHLLIHLQVRVPGLTLVLTQAAVEHSWVALCFGIFLRLLMKRGGMSNMVPLTCFKAT